MIESLSEQLHLSELRIDTTRKLESISELQVELDHSLYDLIPFAYLLMRPGLSSNWGLQTEDNHREDLKEFRIGVLFFKVVSLFRDICALFQSSSELILHLKISPTRASYERRKKEYRAQAYSYSEGVDRAYGRLVDAE
ncbi:hypothetical protein MJO29_006519 [Puccinia striiformis f. sp. tritici]|nr:hypothetical protein MJO29_006519 [Puccinia striiformis f. sp. tritici]